MTQARPPKNVNLRESWPEITDYTAPDGLLKAVLASLSSHLVVLDRDGVIKYVSPSWDALACSNYAWPGTVSIGVNYLDVCRRAASLGDDSAGTALDAINSVLEGKETRATVEYASETPATTRWYLIIVDAMRGDRWGVVITHTDITEQKRAESELSEIKQRYSMATCVGGVSVWDVNVGTGSVFVDSSFLSLLGYHDDQPKSSREWIDLIHPEDRERFLAHQRAAFTPDAPRDREGNTPIAGVEYRVIGKDGTHRWFLSRGTVLRNSDGSPYRVIGIAADITERKSIEERLGRKDEFFRTLIENASDIISIFALDGTILYDSPAMERVFGFGPEDRVGHSVFEHLHPDDVAGFAAALTRVVELGSSDAFEYRQRHKDGSWRVLEKVCSRIVNESGEPVVISNLRDVTSRKQGEDALRESRRFSQSVADTMPGVLYLYELNKGRCVDSNRRILEVLGYTPEEMKEMGNDQLWALLHPEDFDRMVRHSHLLKMAKDGEVFECEYRLRKKNGDWCWVEGRQTVFSRDAFGAPALVLGTAQDITTRKKAEESLIRSEERFAAAFRASPYVLVIGRQSDGRIIDVNEKWEELFHYTRNESIGRSALELGIIADPDDQEKLRHMRVEGGSRGLEVPLKNRKGEVRRTLVSTEIITIDDEPCFITIIQDITERKQVEESLRRSNEQILELAGKLLTAQEEERRRISRELHDDLSQRLASLSIDMSRVMQTLPAADEFVRCELSRMQQHVVDLAESVRELSHNLHPAVLEHAGLVAALRSFVAQFERLEGVQVELRLPDVRLDPPREGALCLYRIAQEALHNVAKHSGEKKATLSLSIEVNQIELSVTDTGRGFDPDRVDLAGHLGLASMEERVRLVGGSLTVQSEPGKGVTITARVPVERRKR